MCDGMATMVWVSTCLVKGRYYGVQSLYLTIRKVISCVSSLAVI